MGFLGSILGFVCVLEILPDMISVLGFGIALNFCDQNLFGLLRRPYWCFSFESEWYWWFCVVDLLMDTFHVCSHLQECLLDIFQNS